MNTHPASQAWARANNLARITGKEPSTVRSYLATLPKETQQAINGAKRRDNPTLKPHIEALQTYQPPQKTTRKSHGDPTKPPRAGAPNPTNTTDININNLAALKKYADTHGGIQQLTTDLQTLTKILGTT